MSTDTVIAIHFVAIENNDFQRLENFEEDTISYEDNLHIFSLSCANITGTIINQKSFSLDPDHHSMELEIEFPLLPKNQRLYLVETIAEFIQEKYNLSCYLYPCAKDQNPAPFNFCV